MNASRQLQRLLSVTKSPIYAFFSESVSGLSTIRAYGRQSHFIAECEARVDSFTRVFVPFVIGNRSCFLLIVVVFYYIRTDILNTGWPLTRKTGKTGKSQRKLLVIKKSGNTVREIHEKLSKSWKSENEIVLSNVLKMSTSRILFNILSQEKELSVLLFAILLINCSQRKHI